MRYSVGRQNLLDFAINRNVFKIAHYQELTRQLGDMIMNQSNQELVDLKE